MRTDSRLYRLINSNCFQFAGGFVLLMLVVGSAIFAKEVSAPPLAVLEPVEVHTAKAKPSQTARTASLRGAQHAKKSASSAVTESPVSDKAAAEIRWFNGRPIRPARAVWMKVTAYSPGPESCAPFDDGKTATLHSVWTNAMNLVAADTSILPFGSLVSVPGYDDGRVVPVLDRGGAIKGMTLDVLYPTATEARQWGVQRLPVVIWEYADGLPADNPREFR